MKNVSRNFIVTWYSDIFPEPKRKRICRGAGNTLAFVMRLIDTGCKVECTEIIKKDGEQWHERKDIQTKKN